MTNKLMRSHKDATIERFQNDDARGDLSPNLLPGRIISRHEQ